MSRFTRLFTIIVLAVTLQSVTLQAQQPPLAFDLERVQRATVFVIQARNLEDRLEITCIGTGTIVTRDGLVLTNAHNTQQSSGCPGETLIIALSTSLDEPPVPTYRAEIAQLDPGLDLALLNINQEIDGRVIEPGTLALPFVELADSNFVELDDTLNIVGYPGIGNDPVTVVRGTVSGFVAEPSGGSKSWIKTSAAISGAMTGGGAYNQTGQLVGIPTTAPVTGDNLNAACIWDTNNDGLVNQRDTCIPTGDDINALRPSNFARPLLRAASLSLSVQTIGDLPVVSASEDEEPTFRRLFFAPAVNEANMPTTVLRRLPTGSNSLYLFFDYENMSPETVYSLRVTIDGIPNATFSLAPVRWGGEERGIWYLGSDTQPLPNGVYEYTLFADGVAADTARLIVGGGSEAAPTFADISFGLLDQDGNVLGNGFILPTGTIASARFLYRNMPNNAPWTAIWYYNGAEVSRTPAENVWTDGESGAKTINIQADGGLLPGVYRLELFIDGILAATSDFTIAGGQQGAFAQIFSNPHFATADTPAEARRAAPVNNFPGATDTIYGVFDWQRIAEGTPWTLRWLVDDEVFYERTLPWVGSENGEDYLVQLSAPGSLPDGTYQLEMFVGRLQLASLTARVGIGQLPIDRFALATGVELRGQILDADTREGIPGATFMLLGAEFSVEDFEWNENQLYALSVSDRNGRFEIDRLLEFSTEDNPVPYSAIIIAEGYLPITADGIEITPEDDVPLDLTIFMTRDAS